MFVNVRYLSWSINAFSTEAYLLELTQPAEQMTSVVMLIIAEYGSMHQRKCFVEVRKQSHHTFSGVR